MLRNTTLLLLIVSMGCQNEDPATEKPPAETPSSDENIARCDRIAARYVEYFADQDKHGTTRKLFLEKCVLGPDKAYTEHGMEWVTCMDQAVSAGEMSNCQEVFDYRLKMDKIKAVEDSITAGLKAYVCTGADDAKVKEHEERIEALRKEAKDFGAEESELPSVESVINGRSGDELRKDLCK